MLGTRGLLLLSKLVIFAVDSKGLNTLGAMKFMIDTGVVRDTECQAPSQEA